MNKSEKAVNIVKMSGYYLDGEEKKSMSIRHGTRSGMYNYSWSRAENFKVGGSQMCDMAFQCTTEVKGVQYDRRRRGHRSLPDPIHITIQLEDEHGNSTSMNVTHKNLPLVRH